MVRIQNIHYYILVCLSLSITQFPSLWVHLSILSTQQLLLIILFVHWFAQHRQLIWFHVNFRRKTVLWLLMMMRYWKMTAVGTFCLIMHIYSIEWWTILCVDVMIILQFNVIWNQNSILSPFRGHIWKSFRQYIFIWSKIYLHVHSRECLWLCTPMVLNLIIRSEIIFYVPLCHFCKRCIESICKPIIEQRQMVKYIGCIKNIIHFLWLQHKNRYKWLYFILCDSIYTCHVSHSLNHEWPLTWQWLE